MSTFAVGLRVVHKPPTVARTGPGLSENRRAYDFRRRLNRDSQSTILYKRVIGYDPCYVCGEREPGRVNDRDHIVPLMAGGADDWTNLTTACRGHNRGRRDRSLLGYLLEQV